MYRCRTWISSGSLINVLSVSGGFVKGRMFKHKSGESEEKIVCKSSVDSGDNENENDNDHNRSS